MKTGLAFSILMVDDDEDDRMIMDEAFLKRGYGSEIKKFKDGLGLFHYMENIEASLYPNLIVLDANLPDMSTEDIISQLKENSSYHSIPIVIYSSHLSPLKKKQLEALGIHSTVQKANTMEELQQLVDNLKGLADSQGKDELLA